MKGRLMKDNIVIPNAPSLPGLTFRHFRGESDYPVIMDIYNACKDMDGTDTIATLESITHNYSHLERCDPFTGMIFAEVDGQAVAYGRVTWFQEEQGDYGYIAFGWIKPEWRRKGIGTAMLKHNEQRLSEIASQHPAEAKKFFQCTYNNQQVGAAALLKVNEYQEVRWAYEMTRPTADPLPEAPMPAGVEVRPSSQEQTRPIWDALSEAFSESWSFVPATETTFQRWVSAPTFNPSLWKVAWDGNEVAGMVLNVVDPDNTFVDGRKRGWTDPICVRKPWRRLGLARSLLVQSILMFRELGFNETALGVDTQNPDHALSLYEGVGYKTVRKTTICRKNTPNLPPTT
jgi:ribosomal protein S18 acetylase RimI-like enzyme